VRRRVGVGLKDGTDDGARGNAGRLACKKARSQARMAKWGHKARGLRRKKKKDHIRRVGLVKSVVRSKVECSQRGEGGLTKQEGSRMGGGDERARQHRCLSGASIPGDDAGRSFVGNERTIGTDTCLLVMPGFTKKKG